MARNEILETGLMPYNDIDQSSLTAWSGNLHLQPMDCSMIDENATGLIIIEQPHARKLRFRYKSEGETAGSIVGENSTAERPTYPTLQVINCQGPAEIVVSAVSKDDPICPHPYSLVGKDCKDGVCILKVAPGQTIVSCFGMGVRCEKKKDVPEAFGLKKRNPRQAFRDEMSRRPDDLDVNCLRLCFQLYQPHPEFPDSMSLVSQPVLSNPIFDKKAAGTCNLQIVRMDKTSGKVTGGDEIYMFVEKVKKDDIEIRFIDGKWESKAEFGQSDVHKQYAIVFKTPAYQKLDISNPATVQIKLYRPSNSEYSDPVKFIYKPAISDSEEIQRKRKKFASFDKFLKGNQPSLFRKPLPEPELLPRPSHYVRERLPMKAEHSADSSMPIPYQRMNHWQNVTGQQQRLPAMPSGGQPPNRQALKRPLENHGATTTQTAHMVSGQRQSFKFCAGRTAGIPGEYQQVPAMPPALTKPPDEFPIRSVLDFAETHSVPVIGQAMSEMLERRTPSPHGSQREQGTRDVRLERKTPLPHGSPRPAFEANPSSPSHGGSYSQQSPTIEPSATEDKFFDQMLTSLSQTPQSSLEGLTLESVDEFFAASELQTNNSSTPKQNVSVNPARKDLLYLHSDVVCDGSPLTELVDPPFTHVVKTDTAFQLNTAADLLDTGSLDAPRMHGTVDQTVPINDGGIINHVGTNAFQDEQVVPVTGLYPTVSSVIDHNGGKLEMSDLGVSLVVPANALAPGRTERISLSISWHKPDKPALGDGEAWISPVVCCEPTGIRFDTPVALSFEHCLNFKDKHRGRISLQCSNTELGAQNRWMKKSIEDTDECTCLVTENRCVIITDHFTKYGLSADMTEDMSKRIKVAVFTAPIEHPHSDVILRVYAIDNTKVAYQEMITEEEHMKGSLAEATKYYHFFDNQADLDVMLESLDDGWQLVKCQTSIALPRKDILEGLKTSCTFRFSNRGKCLQFGSNVQVHQESNTNSPILFTISKSIKQPEQLPVVPVGASMMYRESSTLVHQPYPVTDAAVQQASYAPVTPQLRPVRRPVLALPTIEASFSSDSGMESSLASLSFSPDVLRNVIPFDVKQKLSLLLDPIRDPTGNDWRMLASKMGLSALIPNLSMQRSATQSLLLHWETNHDPSENLHELIGMVEEIGRPDAARILKEYDQLQQRQRNTSSQSLPALVAPDSVDGECVLAANRSAPDLVNVKACNLTTPDIHQLSSDVNRNPAANATEMTGTVQHTHEQFPESGDLLQALNERCNRIQNSQMTDHRILAQRSGSDETNENF